MESPKVNGFALDMEIRRCIAQTEEPPAPPSMKNPAWEDIKRALYHAAEKNPYEAYRLRELMSGILRRRYGIDRISYLPEEFAEDAMQITKAVLYALKGGRLFPFLGAVNENDHKYRKRRGTDERVDQG